MKRLLQELLDFVNGARTLGFTDGGPDALAKKLDVMAKRLAQLEEQAEQVVWHLNNARMAAAKQVAENLLKKLQR